MLSGRSWWGCWHCCTWTWTWTGQSCRQVGMNIFKKRFFLHQILANDWTSGSQLSLSFLLMTLTGEVGGSTSRGRSGFSPRLMSIDWPHIQINHTYHFILSHRVGWSCLVLAEQWGTQLAIGLCLASRSSWPTICWAYRLVFQLSLIICWPSRIQYNWDRCWIFSWFHHQHQQSSQDTKANGKIAWSAAMWEDPFSSGWNNLIWYILLKTWWSCIVGIMWTLLMALAWKPVQLAVSLELANQNAQTVPGCYLW